DYYCQSYDNSLRVLF
nr:immunoglobulin light chain junction region [Macaca mulatta]MOW59530.1 immunoglobulin light chain junction region [Macaca mulatta]MOX28383.1 immunoglobulin light chain junction region [Macaca mulatta]MOX28736.1 immunoglobulin light chain junction region [Macaca mulatta]MOX28897.1 immunoglobulin light chain junction region [Macaca mulatta]